MATDIECGGGVVIIVIRPWQCSIWVARDERDDMDTIVGVTRDSYGGPMTTSWFVPYISTEPRPIRDPARSLVYLGTYLVHNMVPIVLHEVEGFRCDNENWLAGHVTLETMQ